VTAVADNEGLQELLERFTDFLLNLDKYLRKQSVVCNTVTDVVCLTKPQPSEEGYVAYGLLRVSSQYFPFEATLNLEDGWVDIIMDPFIQRIPLDQFKRMVGIE
jgi:hypothetical protein